MNGTRLNIAIIGSGLAGALLADKLSRWHSVTVFERGSAAPQLPSPPKIVGHPIGLFPSFAYGFGGTTNYWHGGLLPMHPDEYGTHWPTSVSTQIEPYQRQVVERLYGVDARDLLEQHRPEEVHQHVLIDNILYPKAPFRAIRSRCFDYAELKFHHRVISIRETQGQVAISGQVGGKTFEYIADVAILAAGGMGSSLILNESCLGGPMAGRHVTDHPVGYVAKIINREGNELLRRLFQSSGGDYRIKPLLKIKDEELGLWVSLFLWPSPTRKINSDPYADAFEALGSPSVWRRCIAGTKQMANADFRAQALSRLSGISSSDKQAYVLAMAEQESLGPNNIKQESQDQVAIEWDISDGVVLAIERAVRKLSAMTGGELIWPDESIRKRLWSGAHHSGGCRIASNACDGVVDNDLRVHGTRSVFVCDGSVLPSTGSSNTGLTIGALALRLASRFSPRKPTRAMPEMNKYPMLHISGTSSSVFHMLLPQLEREGWQYFSASAREEQKKTNNMSGGKFLHLANDRKRPAENRILQQRVAHYLEQCGINEIIVAMTFATLQTTKMRLPAADLFNFGFGVRIREPYVIGKLDAEKFWTSWQSAAPERRVSFLYIPTIRGEHSAWSANMSSYKRNVAVLLPDIRYFFQIAEQSLAEKVLWHCKQNSSAGISRALIYDHASTLMNSVQSDMVPATPVPSGLFNVIYALIAALPFDLTNRILTKGLTVFAKLSSALLSVDLIRISAAYIYIFSAQSHNFDVIKRADAGSDVER